jgi:epoxyqueuosine reductase
MQNSLSHIENYAALAARIKAWGQSLGFQSVGISGIRLNQTEARLMAWLAAGHHGSMDYMAKHGVKRARPDELLPGTQSIITVRMNYLTTSLDDSRAALSDGERAYISRYALGRDYHKVLRHRLQQLADKIQQTIGAFTYRAFTDSAPVMEVALAAQTRLGWRGKHTLLLSREHGSYFFLGELYTNLPLPPDAPARAHCGACTRCLTACPTQAIIAPYQLDARRCISYLTIEHKGSIPLELRPLLGNRIYGCDDCQLACPWNRFAQHTDEPDFVVRHGLDHIKLVELFGWSDATFPPKFAGSAILRVGYEQWLRHLAVALGNAPRSREVVAALQARQYHHSLLVREHVVWALHKS